MQCYNNLFLMNYTE